MEQHQGTNIANGILSGFVLISGIIISALIATVFKEIGDIIGGAFGAQVSAYILLRTAPIWAVGFAYILPGLIGVIASFVRQKGCYIAQMVLMILTLIIMGIFFFLGIFFVLALGTGSTTCTGAGCEVITRMYAMGVSSIVFGVLGWIACLAATITGGILACKRQQVQPGTILQPTTVVQMGHVGQPAYGGQQPVYGGPQQGYGGPSQGYGNNPPGYAPMQGLDKY